MHDDMSAEELHTVRFLGNRHHRNRGFRMQLWAVLPVLLCLGIVLIGIFTFPSPSRALERKNVLILNSYHQGFKWTDDITRGIITAMNPIRPETRFYIEYMNTKWANEERYFKELSRLLAIKYAKTRFDLIVCSDTDALEFLLDHRDEIFGKIPVVFCGVNYFKDEDLQGKPLFTGVSETADLKESLDLTLRLHPGTKEIFVINDNGTPGRKVRDQLEKLVPLYWGKVRFTFAESANLDKIVADVAELPPDTLIFYAFFYGDPALRFYENIESISRISEHARVPIYGTWDFNLGFGIVGGKLTSGYPGRVQESCPVHVRLPAAETIRHRQEPAAEGKHHRQRAGNVSQGQQEHHLVYLARRGWAGFPGVHPVDQYPEAQEGGRIPTQGSC
jgi:ABC-type uncharacterized transport system substrate-binding protein